MMQIIQDFYDIVPQTIWENDQEELRARALPRPAEARIRQMIFDYQSEIIAAAIDEPGIDGEIRRANINMLQGKLLMLQQLLQESRDAHGVLNVPNE